MAISKSNRIPHGSSAGPQGLLSGVAVSTLMGRPPTQVGSNTQTSGGLVKMTGHGGTGTEICKSNSNSHGSSGSPHSGGSITVNTPPPGPAHRVVVTVGGLVLIFGHGGTGIVRLTSSSNSHGSFRSH